MAALQKQEPSIWMQCTPILRAMSSEFGEFFVSSISLIDTYETALRPESLGGTLSTSEIIKLKIWHQIRLLHFYYCQLRVPRYDYLSPSLVTEPTF